MRLNRYHALLVLVLLLAGGVALLLSAPSDQVSITGEHLRNAISPQRTEDKQWWIFCKSHAEFRDAMIENIQK